VKIAIQCDFDGTITVGEVSHLLLTRFASGNWKRSVDEFNCGRMSVTDCMRSCFSQIKADESAMTDYILSDGRVKIREGFAEFPDYCKKKDFYFSIISNGLVFYIDAILEKLGLKGIDVIAAKNTFGNDGLAIEYAGPDGNEAGADFKESYTELLKNKGYNVVCIGDSVTDVPVARRAHYVFATDALKKFCERENIKYFPFDDFYDVINGLESITQGVL
jgi:2-hydroxy-3-keto-5-methylthiopentenyl-1-phosphate phosphatase